MCMWEAKSYGVSIDKRAMINYTSTLWLTANSVARALE